MTFLSVVEFTEPVLGIAFGFGFALLLAFVCLRFLLGLMTRQQYNVTHGHNVINDPSHSRSILWLGAAVAGPDAGSGNDGGSVAIGGPYIVPAAAPLNRFARDSKPDGAFGGRLVELPQFAAERVTQSGSGDFGDAA